MGDTPSDPGKPSDYLRGFQDALEQMRGWADRHPYAGLSPRDPWGQRRDVGSEFVEQVEAFERGDLDEPLAEWERMLVIPSGDHDSLTIIRTGLSHRVRLVCKCGKGWDDVHDITGRRLWERHAAESRFEPRPMGAEDVNGETWVRIWDAQKSGPFDEGKIIAYCDVPSVVIERADGSHEHWVASLPWERIDPR